MSIFENPLIIIFLASIILVAIYMAIEGFVLLYNVGHMIMAKMASRTNLDDDNEEGVLPPSPTETSRVNDNEEVEFDPLLKAMATAKPHLIVVGGTGGGKSVLVRAFTDFLVRTGASVVALDPDASARHYPAPVHLINNDEMWKVAIDVIATEFCTRNRQFREEEREVFPALWVVADECQELLAIEGVLETIERVIRRGRKLNIHIVLAVQDSQVRTLGLERKSSLLVNLTRIEVTKNSDTRSATVDGKEYTVPVFPMHYDGARGVVLDLGKTTQQDTQRTERHEQCVAILQECPEISGRKLAKALYGHETGKSYNLAKKIREDIDTMD